MLEISEEPHYSSSDIKIKREWYKQLYVHRFNNVCDVGKFVEKHKLTNLIQEEIDNLNCPISIKKYLTLQLKFSTKKLPEPDGFTSKFYQMFKEEIIPILYKLFLKMEEERVLRKSFYEDSITLIKTR